jgi:hypothetical protein
MAREEQDRMTPRAGSDTETGEVHMAHKVSTTEALMTDPTTPQGAVYWQERHDGEIIAERAAARVLAERAMLAEWLQIAATQAVATPPEFIRQLLDAAEQAGVQFSQ